MPRYGRLFLIWNLNRQILCEKRKSILLKYTLVRKFQTGCPAISGPSNCLAILSNVSHDHKEATSGGKIPRL